MDFDYLVAFEIRIKVDLNNIKATFFANALMFCKIAFRGADDVPLLLEVNRGGRLGQRGLLCRVKASCFDLHKDEILAVLDDQINFASKGGEVSTNNAVAGFAKMPCCGFFSEVTACTAKRQRLHESRNFKKERR